MTTIIDSMRYLVRGPGATSVLRSPNVRPIVESTPTLRTSHVFDSHRHALAEAQHNRTQPQAVSLAWDERESKSISDSTAAWQGLSARQRKEILLSIYLANPWVSDCVDVIANRIASGGYVIEAVEQGKGDQKNYQILQDFLLRINDEWDFLQFVRSSIQNILVFGESFSENTWRDGVPWQMYLVDCITMSTRTDRTGRVTAYLQQLDNTSVTNPLDPKNIIRWWRPHLKSSVDPFSPIEKVQDAVLAEGKMVKWVQTFFQKGAKFPYYIKGGKDFPREEAERFKVWFEQNSTGEKNANMPPITYGDTEIVPIGKGSIDIDFEHGRDRNRTEIISAFHVPPAIVSIIESGSIGGGTGEDQDKSFQYNACDPIKQLFFEKFNDRITKRGFGITDWRISSKYADFRNDKDLAEVQDKRLRNGTRTANELRQEDGKKPYKDGGDVAVIVTTRQITPVPRIKDLEEESRQTAQAALQTAQADADLATTKAKQAKEPPPEPPEPSAGPAGGPPTPPVPPSGGNAAPMPPAAKPAPITAAAQSESEHGENYLTHQRALTEGREQPASAAAFMRDMAQLIRYTEAKKGQSSDEHATHPQSQTRHAEHARPDPQTSDRPLHPLLPAVEAGQDHSTGMMLAFMLDPEVAQQLAIPSGEPVEGMHLTLSYLGDTAETPMQYPEMLYPDSSPELAARLIQTVTSTTPPLTGKIGGIGRFTSQAASMTPTPVIATVDVPGLVELQTQLVDALKQANFFVGDAHGYTPHITLAFIPPDAPMPIEAVPPLALILDTVTLCVGDARIPFKLTGEPPHPPSPELESVQSPPDAQASQSASDQHKAELAAFILALFLAVRTRGSAALTSLAAAIVVYSLTDEERQSFIEELAEAYLWGQTWAYARAMAAVGMTVAADALPDLFPAPDATAWATGQVSDILDTFTDQLGSFVSTLPHDMPEADAETALDDWVTHYADYKAPQVANVTVGTAVNLGTRTATTDMLDALTNVGIDTSGIPDGLDASQIRVRVVPATSSPDECSEWAGKSVPLDAADTLPYLPMHTGCIHSLEVYVVGENAL